jgi:hypothetical protein
MPPRHFRWAPPLVLFVLTACSDSPDPWSRLPNPPLTQGVLHTATVAGETAPAREQARAAGYTALAFASNYPPALRVEATLWAVPEPVAAKALLFRSPGNGVDLRFLEMPLAARGMKASAATERSFFRQVLGTDVPELPAAISRSSSLRVQAWTFIVPSVVEASRRLRENGIPVVFDAAALTTPYLGDHKTLAIRAPDGTIVQLVETAAR